MVMFEQSRRLSEPLRWGRREKLALGAFLGCVVLALIGLGIYGLSSGAPARADCIRVTFASTLGGADLHGCGAQARRICASGEFRSIAEELRAACGHAGMLYRAPH
ncbi:MAG TPA: hypothetical protein VII01_15295 [Solirubrobacteraceae bacterium]|jgi:hypothetical protein